MNKAVKRASVAAIAVFILTELILAWNTRSAHDPGQTQQTGHGSASTDSVPQAAATNHQAQQIQDPGLQPAIDRYYLAKMDGSAVDAYRAARVVSEAFLRAKDEQNYNKWKAIELKEAKLAGITDPE